MTNWNQNWLFLRNKLKKWCNFDLKNRDIWGFLGGILGFLVPVSIYGARGFELEFELVWKSKCAKKRVNTWFLSFLP